MTEGYAHRPIERMELFQTFIRVADWTYRAVTRWNPLARETVGKQLIRAADSIGANLVEGDGRYAKNDAIHFFVIARASARETRYWLERAQERGLLSEQEMNAQRESLLTATRQLNALIRYRREKEPPEKVKESETSYRLNDDDPFLEALPIPDTQHPTPFE